jgi:hypothetical protein
MSGARSAPRTRKRINVTFTPQQKAMRRSPPSYTSDDVSFLEKTLRAATRPPFSGDDLGGFLRGYLPPGVVQGVSPPSG